MDARVIAMVAKMDKTQEERVLEGEHALLRELGRGSAFGAPHYRSSDPEKAEVPLKPFRQASEGFGRKYEGREYEGGKGLQVRIPRTDFPFGDCTWANRSSLQIPLTAASFDICHGPCFLPAI